MVWYFTKSPCTIENATAGLCNASVAARFINYQILAQCILLGLAVAAVKGGYDEIMVSRERKRADEAEQRAEEAEERLRFERKRADEMIEEIRAERREEMQAWREEREADRLERQAMMETIAQMSNAIEELLERRNSRSPEN